MGKQVLIYATPEDLEELENFLRTRLDFSVIASRSSVTKPQPSNSLSVADPGEGGLWAYLVRPEDVRAVVLKEVRSKSYWTIDVLRSPVVELRRCYFDGRVLRQGRFFFETGYYRDDSWKDKPKQFVDWADTVFRIAKHFFKHERSLRAYVGKHAEQWRAEPGRAFVWK